jgi:hypothetical protein
LAELRQFMRKGRHRANVWQLTMLRAVSQAGTRALAELRQFI